jgi:alpha-ketoglutarate-dependent taurine dioxygenase
VCVTSHEHEIADVEAWARLHGSEIDELLDRHRALLLRGFHVDTVDKFEGLLSGLRCTLVQYSERSTPRSTIRGRIYSSTEYPQSDEIPLHNENSYSVAWPRRVIFCCLHPPATGGETSIADSREVYNALDPAIRQRFLEKRVMYVRNYGLGVDLTWQEAFQTDRHEEVEDYCRAFDLSFEWFDGGLGLHTEQVRPAALRYLPTREQVWFNQAHLFHVSSLPPAAALALRELFPLHRLPRHSFYGDGTAIEDEVLDAIRSAYRDASLLINWERGDVLLLDNLFYAHGRSSFTGERTVIVGMDNRGGADTSPVSLVS